MPRLRFVSFAALLALGLLGKAVLVGERLLTGLETSVVVPVAVASEGIGAEAGRSDRDDGKAAHTTGESKPQRREAMACPSPPPPPEPKGPTFSETELAVLQQLAERRDDLARREEELQHREMLLSATQTRIDEKVASMKALQATLEGLIQQHDTEQDAKLKSLVKIYETMKPVEAARIFEQLDSETLLPVVERMNERKLAAILAKLDPMKARDVTVDLQKLRALTAPPPPDAQ